MTRAGGDRVLGASAVSVGWAANPLVLVEGPGDALARTRPPAAGP
jgi:hypothetical protein